jgi:septum formation protein
MLERVGVPLVVRAADVDETPLPGERPEPYVARIARAKAHAVERAPGQWVLAADTTVTIDDEILGKAETPEEATRMLERLSGRVHQVITAFVVLGDREHTGRAVSDVHVIDLAPALIADYVASNEWRGKAGAYAIQGIAAAFVKEVRGSVTNVIGLPLVEVLATLRQVGAPAARFANGKPA